MAVRKTVPRGLRACLDCDIFCFISIFERLLFLEQFLIFLNPYTFVQKKREIHNENLRFEGKKASLIISEDLSAQTEYEFRGPPRAVSRSMAKSSFLPLADHLLTILTAFVSGPLPPTSRQRRLQGPLTSMNGSATNGLCSFLIPKTTLQSAPPSWAPLQSLNLNSPSVASS